MPACEPFYLLQKYKKLIKKVCKVNPLIYLEYDSLINEALIISLNILHRILGVPGTQKIDSLNKILLRLTP